MELKCNKKYLALGITMLPGDTTVGLDVSDAKKNQMLKDYPDKFELIEAVVAPAAKGDETKVLSVDTKEAVETPKKTAARSRKKKADK